MSRFLACAGYSGWRLELVKFYCVVRILEFQNPTVVADVLRLVLRRELCHVNLCLGNSRTETHRQPATSNAYTLPVSFKSEVRRRAGHAWARCLIPLLLKRQPLSSLLRNLSQ